MRYVFTDGVNKDGIQSVYCVSHFAGNAVRGVAKCDPTDAFDYEKGVQLAQLRCDEKIAKKRVKRAQKKFSEAGDAVVAAQRHAVDMQAYLNDALADLIRATEARKKFESSL